MIDTLRPCMIDPVLDVNSAVWLDKEKGPPLNLLVWTFKGTGLGR